jgi:hypothetical protein
VRHTVHLDPALGEAGVEVPVRGRRVLERLLERLVRRMLEPRSRLERELARGLAECGVRCPRPLDADVHGGEDRGGPGVHVEARTPGLGAFVERVPDLGAVVAEGLERAGGLPWRALVQAQRLGLGKRSLL